MTVQVLLLNVCLGVAFMVAACGDAPSGSMASGQRRMAAGDHAGALIEFKNALAQEPASAQLRLLLAKALLETGDPAAASIEFGKAAELGASPGLIAPDQAKALLQLGQAEAVIAQFSSLTLADPPAMADLRTWVAAAYAQKGDRDRAEQELAAALKALPGHPAAMMVQARMHAARGDVAGAQALLDQVLAREPGNEFAGVAKAQLKWLSQRDGAGSAAAYRAVLAAKPRNIQARAGLVDVLLSEGSADGARTEFEPLRKSAPQHPETLFLEARFAYLDGNLQRARELAEVLLKMSPDNLRALELAGVAEMQLGNQESAQAYLARALRLVPDLVLARQAMAQSHLRAGEAAKALKTLGALIEGPDADPDSLAIAGAAHLQLGQAQRADAAFAKAAKLAPQSSRVRTAAAVALFNAGRGDSATAELAAIAAGDSSPRADLALISAHIARRDLKAALAALPALEAKMPQHPLPHQIRGQLLLATRDVPAARRSFEAALKIAPRYFAAVAALTTIDAASGNVDAARDRVTTFLKGQPGHADALALLAELPGLASHDAALQALTAAAKANPGDVRAQIALIGRLIGMGDRPGALAAAQMAAATMPNDPVIVRALAQSQLLAGEAQQALASVNRLVTLEPDSASAQILLAEVQLAARNPQQAARALRRAIELDDQQHEAWRSLVMLSLRDGRHDEALSTARMLQSKHPKAAVGFALEGDVEAYRRNWKAATVAYRAAYDRGEASEAAIKLHTALRGAGDTTAADRLAADWLRKRAQDAPIRFYLGDLALSEKRWSEAEQHYRAVLGVQPKNALAMNNIAWLLLRESKPGALELAARANELLPNRAPILDTLAAAQAAQNRLPDAAATQRRAVAAAPEDHKLRVNLARYLIGAGRRDEAKAELERLAGLGEAFGEQAEVRRLLSKL